MRRPFVCGNWKMYKTSSEARALAREIRNGLRGDSEEVEVAVLSAVPRAVGRRRGARRVPDRMGRPELRSAARGSVHRGSGCAMLVDLGCRFVILGHSERRQYFGETDEGVREKLSAALGAGLTPILCVGELLTRLQQADRVFDALDIALPVGADLDLELAVSVVAQQLHRRLHLRGISLRRRAIHR